MQSYQSKRNVRREARTLIGRFKGGKLTPVMQTVVRGSEGGMLSQSITLELDPIAGRMITPISAEFISVFVPVQAIDALLNPTSDYAGITDVIREKLLSGNPLFDLSGQTEISLRCGINPRSIGGTKFVSRAVHVSHNAAVNYLRQRKYVKATTLLAGNTLSTPALIGQTVLDRLNGVLDPDDRINGKVQLEIPDMILPVHGIGLTGNTPPGASMSLRNRANPTGERVNAIHTDTSGVMAVRTNSAAGGTAAWANVYSELNGLTAGNVSLTDFYNAEKMDRLTRKMRQIVDDNAQYGEEMVLRWAHGLSVDAGRVPFIISEQTKVFGRSISAASDTNGVQSDVMRSDMLVQMQFTVPVPQTELGGIIVTFATVKPDEVLARQPHPFLSDVWGAENFVADELMLDPVPVTIRELDSNATAGNESTVVLYTGHNQLKANYVHYGLNGLVDPETVENKTAIWQLEIPLSVTPDNILYPANFPQYPFANQAGEICTYTITSNAVLQTPMIIGPTPVETLAILDANDVFGEQN